MERLHIVTDRYPYLQSEPIDQGTIDLLEACRLQEWGDSLERIGKGDDGCFNCDEASYWIGAVETRGGQMWADVEIVDNNCASTKGRLELTNALAVLRFSEHVGQNHQRGYLNQQAAMGADFYSLFGDKPPPLTDRRFAGVVTNRLQQIYSEIVAAKARLSGRAYWDGIVSWEREQEAQKAVVEGLLFEGHFVDVAADEGEGKSLTMEGLAFCVENGIPFCGRKVRQGATLILDGQQGGARLKTRMQLFRRGHRECDGIDDDELEYPFVVDTRKVPIDLLTQGGRAKLLKYARQAEWRQQMPLRVLIIDARDQHIGEASIIEPGPAERFHGEFVRPFQDQFEEPPVVILIINFRKRVVGQGAAGSNWPTQRAAGSGRWKDLADDFLSCKASRQPHGRQIASVRLWAAKDRDACIEDLDIFFDNKEELDLDGGAGKPLWLHLSTLGPTEIPLPPPPGRPAKQDIAEEYLLSVLTDEWQRWATVTEKAKKEKDIGLIPLRAARDKLEAEGIVERKKDGSRLVIRKRKAEEPTK